MKAKREEQQLAREMRAAGLSIKEIAAELRVAVSSVSTWTRGVTVDPEAQKLLDARAVSRRGESRSKTYRERRQRFQEAGRARARQGDALHMAGCMLYWGEGSKGRNSLHFTNSDISMMQFFLRFLRECFSVKDEEVALRLHLHADTAEARQQVEQRWLDALGLPPTCLRRAIVNQVSRASLGLRQGKLPYGTARLSVFSTELVQHIFGAIQEYSGVDNAEWLDNMPGQLTPRPSAHS